MSQIRELPARPLPDDRDEIHVQAGSDFRVRLSDIPKAFAGRGSVENVPSGATDAVLISRINGLLTQLRNSDLIL